MTDRPGTTGSPFGFLRPAASFAVVYAAAVLVWIVAGEHLPGGRWLAVHLFTLGVLTNLILALTYHFAQTVLHSRDAGARRARILVLNAATLAVLVGIVGGYRLATAAGATVATAAVLWLYIDLRRMRKAAIGDRFAFVVRSYERAAGAFTHGAILGALLGVGLLSGGWYGGARLAHLHVNVLGWGGLTLLATLVFFGPTILRTRMEQGADVVAARWIGFAATGLTVAAFALLATGAGGGFAVGARIVATAGLALYAVGATRVCLPVLQAGRRAKPSPHGRLILAASCWFLAAAWAAAGAAGFEASAFYDALGLAMLVGVLGQAVLAALSYLAPMVWVRGPARRAQVRTALERLPLLRPGAFNAGVALVAWSATGLAPTAAGAGMARLGWGLVAAAVLVQAALTVWSAVPRANAGASALSVR